MGGDGSGIDGFLDRIRGGKVEAERVKKGYEDDNRAV